MPTKLEIESNKLDAKKLRKTLSLKKRQNLKQCADLRKLIRASQKKLQKLESSHSNYVKNVNRRIAVLEGRNEE